MEKAIHEQMVNDLDLQRSLDDSWGIKREVVKDVLAEVNERFRQYLTMFPYSLEYFILQTVQDFKQHWLPLQTRHVVGEDYQYKVEMKMPVAMTKDGTLIYADLLSYNRQDFKDASFDELEKMNIFTTVKPLSVLGE